MSDKIGKFTLQSYLGGELLAVWHNGYHVAWLRCIFACLMLPQPHNQPIDDGRRGGMKLTRGIGEDIKSLGHRAVKLTCLLEGPPQVFHQDFRGYYRTYTDDRACA